MGFWLPIFIDLRPLQTSFPGYTKQETIVLKRNLMAVTLTAFITYILDKSSQLLAFPERRGGLMVRVLDSGSSGPGLGPGRGHRVVFLGKTLYSHGSSLHPGV